MTKKQILTKADLLKPKTRRFESKDGYVIILHALPAAYALSLKNQTIDEAKVFEIVSHSISTEDGDTFTTDEAGQLPISLVNEILEAVLEFNGLKPEAIEKAKEDLKNSPTEGSVIN